MAYLRDMAKDKQLAQNLNEDRMRMRLSDLERILSKVRQGGGPKRIEKEHAKGKWTARERLDRLFDKGSKRLEIGALAGHGMYEAEGGCPSGGVVVELGRIQGKLCLVVANDATVRSKAARADPDAPAPLALPTTLTALAWQASAAMATSAQPAKVYWKGAATTGTLA